MDNKNAENQPEFKLTDRDVENMLYDYSDKKPKINSYEDRVASLELSQRLKANWFTQETEYCWAYNFDLDNKRQSGHQVISTYQLGFLGAEEHFICAAPTAKEILKTIKGKNADQLARVWLTERTT